MKNFAILAALLALATGCNRSNQKVIGVIPKATSHVFWTNTQAGAMAAGKDFKVEIDWNGPSAETEYSRQIQILDAMIARRVDGIAIAAADRKALIAPVNRAVSAGIPVTVFDSGLDSLNYLTFVATNNYEGGRVAARTLAQLIGGEGDIAVVLHAPGSLSTMDRERGFREAIANEFPKIRIVAEQFGMSDRAKALAAAENILAAHPGLKGLFASAEPSSVGAALAMKQRQLAGKIRLVTFDSSDNLIEELKAGVIDAMLVQDPYKIGYEAVRCLVDHLNGKTPPKRIDLDARVVTKADLDKPDIQKLLHPGGK
jgi:ribose transport system substrate-binding protein